jgi:hypothetical protein
MIERLDTENEQPICKYCQSPNVIKFGTSNGVQPCWCKDKAHGQPSWLYNLMWP